MVVIAFLMAAVGADQTEEAAHHGQTPPQMSQRNSSFS